MRMKMGTKGKVGRIRGTSPRITMAKPLMDFLLFWCVNRKDATFMNFFMF